MDMELFSFGISDTAGRECFLLFPLSYLPASRSTSPKYSLLSPPIFLFFFFPFFPALIWCFGSADLEFFFSSLFTWLWWFTAFFFVGMALDKKGHLGFARILGWDWRDRSGSWHSGPGSCYGMKRWDWECWGNGAMEDIDNNGSFGGW